MTTLLISLQGYLCIIKLGRNTALTNMKGVVIIKFIQFLMLSGNFSMTDPSFLLTSAGQLSLWLSSGLQHASLRSLCPHRLISLHAHYRCPSLLMSQERPASLITNLETSQLLYLFSRQDLTHSCLYPGSGIKRFHQTCIKKQSSHLIWISTVTAEEEGVCDGKCYWRLTGEEGKKGTRGEKSILLENCVTNLQNWCIFNSTWRHFCDPVR